MSIVRRTVESTRPPERLLLGRAVKIEIFPAGCLSDDLLCQWTGLQQSNPDLCSPFFCPEFTLAIAAARDDVFVGVLEQEGKVVGFFPFQRGNHAVGKPVGWQMCDYQGVVAGRETVWDPAQLLRGCGLVAWDFDHLVLSQQPFLGCIRATSKSPILNLSGGFEKYAEEKQRIGSRLLRQNGQKTRKMEREIGPIRFEPRLADHTTLDWLLGLYAQKWASAGCVDQRVRTVLHQVLETQTEGFAGRLSALYAGDELVAASFGMQSGTVWHYWFSARDERFARYSPCVILLLKTAAAAPSLGIEVLDLGKGVHPYKRRLMNDAIRVGEGSVEIPSLVAAARVTRRRIKALIRQRPLIYVPARTVATALGSLRRKLRLE